MQRYIFLFIMFIQGIGLAQTALLIHSIDLVEAPTAVTMPKGSYHVSIKTYDQGGVLSQLGVALTDRFMFGISFGGSSVLGSGSVNWNPQVGVQLKYQLSREELNFPALAIGYNSQGAGGYLGDLKRYTEKSNGLYIALSKSYSLLGMFAVHAGIGRSFELSDGDSDPSIFIGVEKSINSELTVLSEYNFATDDNREIVGMGKGYLHAAIKWNLLDKFDLEFIVRDILENNLKSSSASRELMIRYFEKF